MAGTFDLKFPIPASLLYTLLFSGLRRELWIPEPKGQSQVPKQFLSKVSPICFSTHLIQRSIESQVCSEWLQSFCLYFSPLFYLHSGLSAESVLHFALTFGWDNCIIALPIPHNLWWIFSFFYHLEGSKPQIPQRDLQNLTVERIRALLREKGLSQRGRKVSNIYIYFLHYILDFLAVESSVHSFIVSGSSLRILAS